MLIIGAGAIGLYGWYCANLVELSGYIIEASTQTGGQLLTPMARNRIIRDLPCILKITGQEIWQRLRHQAQSVPSTLELIQNTLPLQLQISPSHFIVTLATSQILMVKNIIITSGNGTLQPRKWEIKPQFKNVFYQPKIWKQFKNRSVTVMGGGDGAITTAIELVERSQVAHVNVVCKRTFLRAKPHLVSKLQQHPHVSWFLGYQLLPQHIKATTTTLQSITVTSVHGQQKIIHSDYYIIQYGLMMNLTQIQTWPIKLTTQQKIIINQQSQTNIANMYAAGDVTHYPNKMYSLTVGFGEIATAIYNIVRTKPQCPPTYFGDQQA